MSNEATELLARVSARYAACASYRDEGTVTSRVYSPTKWVMRWRFSTRFLRDKGFLLEFRTHHQGSDRDQYAVWTENGVARAFWSAMPERDEAGSLAAALGRAGGVSGGLAHRVPLLLMPELDWHTRDGAQAVKIVDNPKAGGCSVLERPSREDGQEQIWVDRASLLINRIVEPRHPLGLLPQDAAARLNASWPAAADVVSRFTDPRRERAEVGTSTIYRAMFDSPVSPDELTFVRPR